MLKIQTAACTVFSVQGTASIKDLSCGDLATSCSIPSGQVCITFALFIGIDNIQKHLVYCYFDDVIELCNVIGTK